MTFSRDPAERRACFFQARLVHVGRSGIVLPHPLARRGAGGEGESAGPALHWPLRGRLAGETCRF